jgi:serine/threonine protein phosphatase 1
MLLRTVDEIQENLTVEELGMLSDWMLNGAEPTINAFHKLDEYEREDVLDYLGEFSAYEWVQADGEKYFLVHAGLGNFAPGRSLDDYTLDELVWQRADYDETYFKDVYVLTGHTPTQKIADNPRPGYIYRKNRHIAIDCAAFAEGGRLAAVCLESGEEFYSEV